MGKIGGKKLRVKFFILSGKRRLCLTIVLAVTSIAAFVAVLMCV